MIPVELATTVQRLTAGRRPFVLATVIRAGRPTSVRPGDTAVVLADGTIDGFVGGVCAQSSVRLHGLRALETGEPLLLRLVPGDPGGDGADGARAGTVDGAVVEHNPCRQHPGRCPATSFGPRLDAWFVLSRWRSGRDWRRDHFDRAA